MTTELRLPDSQTAHDIIVAIDKQAFFGRLQQLGEQPETEKEAAAVLDLSYNIAQDQADNPVPQGQQNPYGDGFYSQVKQAFDYQQAAEEIAPGFPKAASEAVHYAGSQFPEALVDAAYDAAYNLSLDPEIYGAAVVKRADNERMMAEAMAARQSQEQPEG